MLKLLVYIFKFHKKELAVVFGLLLLVAFIGLYTNTNSPVYELHGNSKGYNNGATFILLIVLFIIVFIYNVNRKAKNK